MALDTHDGRIIKLTWTTTQTKELGYEVSISGSADASANIEFDATALFIKNKNINMNIIFVPPRNRRYMPKKTNEQKLKYFTHLIIKKSRLFWKEEFHFE